MKLKIVSDGTDSGTSVVDAETGKVVDNVIKVLWKKGLGEPSRAVVEFLDVDIDAEADEAEIISRPTA